MWVLSELCHGGIRTGSIEPPLAEEILYDYFNVVWLTTNALRVYTSDTKYHDSNKCLSGMKETRLGELLYLRVSRRFMV